VACLPGSATPMFPRQLLKAIIVMHVNELKSFKKSKSMIKRKTWMRKKKVSCECSGSIFKKTKQTTATKNKKQFTHQSDSESHCGLLTRKKRKKRNNDQWQSRCHILLRSTKMKENYKKKSKSKAFFMFFQQHYKRTNFSVFDDHIYARSPSRPI